MKVLTQTTMGFVATVNTGDIAGATPDLSRYDIVMIESDQPVAVHGSLDGKTFASTALALEDCHVAAGVGTRVLVTAANKIFRVCPESKFSKLQIRQNGATPFTVCRILLGRRQGD